MTYKELDGLNYELDSIHNLNNVVETITLKKIHYVKLGKNDQLQKLKCFDIKLFLFYDINVLY